MADLVVDLDRVLILTVQVKANGRRSYSDRLLGSLNTRGKYEFQSANCDAVFG